MGQYQEWLHHHERDEQLQAELATLEIELAELQEQVRSSEQGAPHDDNQIIDVLSGTLLATGPVENPSEQISAAQQEEELAQIEQLPVEVEYWIEEEANDALPLQPALAAWGSLPNFAAQGVPIEAAKAFMGTTFAIPRTSYDRSTQDSSLPPSLSHPEIVLLPEDMSTIFDEYTATDPQVKLPWWHRDYTDADEQSSRNLPTDRESIRTDYLIQRWGERWGRQYDQQPPPGAGEDTHHE